MNYSEYMSFTGTNKFLPENFRCIETHYERLNIILEFTKVVLMKKDNFSVVDGVHVPNPRTHENPHVAPLSGMDDISVVKDENSLPFLDPHQRKENKDHLKSITSIWSRIKQETFFLSEDIPVKMVYTTTED